MHRTAVVRFAKTVNMDRWLTGKVKSHKVHSLYDKDANNCNWQAFESQHTTRMQTIATGKHSKANTRQGCKQL